MIATAAKNPLLAITPEEGKMLALAVVELSKQYAISIDPKAMAWFNLFAAACAVYGPKAFYLWASRQNKPKAEPVPVGVDSITPLHKGPLKFD